MVTISDVFTRKNMNLFIGAAAAGGLGLVILTDKETLVKESVVPLVYDIALHALEYYKPSRSPSAPLLDFSIAAVLTALNVHRISDIFKKDHLTPIPLKAIDLFVHTFNISHHLESVS